MYLYIRAYTMVNGTNTKMHDIVMSYIPKKNGGGNINAPAPIFKGSVPTLKLQSAGNHASPKKKTPVAVAPPSKHETKVQFEQKQPPVAPEHKTTVEKIEPVKKTEPVREETKINNTKELVEKNDSLAEVDRENIKISKKKKQIIVSAKTLIENIIDQKLKKSYVNNIVSKTAPAQPVRSRSNSNNNYRKYNQQFLTTQVFDIEPKKTANSFRDVSFKIDGKKERRSRRKKSRDGKKKSRDENKKKRKSSEIKIKKTTPPHLRNDLEKILDGVNIA
jgi:hypothetical protein